MSEEKKKSKKKSKSRHEYDADYVEREVAKAMKEMEEAMKGMKTAEKAARKAHKESKMSEETTEQSSDGMKIFHTSKYFPGTYINIGSAKNVQVGSNNVMHINKKVKGRRSSKQDSSSDSGDEGLTPVPRPALVPLQDRDPSTLTETDRRIYHVLCSQREVTQEDIQGCSEHIVNWKRFLRYLGLEDGTLEQLHQDFHAEGVREVIQQGVTTWARQNGRNATVGLLAQTLQKVDNEDVISYLKP